MKTLYVLLAIALVIDSKYVNRQKKVKSKYQRQQPWGINGVQNQNFDLRGDLRRLFAFEATLANPTKSVICSPISALLPLGKLALGSTGATKKELVKAIGAADVAQHFNDLLSKLSLVKGIHLDIASQVYLSNTKQLLSSYQSKVMQVFSSTVNSVNMGDPNGVASKINSWVSRQTHGKIEKIVTPKDISKSVSVILVNAVYFSGKWAKPFETVKEELFFGPNAAIKMPMMTMTEYFSYGESEQLSAQIIKIPYQKDQVYFTIILPNKKDGLPHMLHKLRQNPDLLNSAELYSRKVKLTMPKFKIETEFDLGRLYELIGLKEIFSSGMHEMVQNEDVVVGKAIQKAMIEVTEEGTVAAAASVVQIMMTSMQGQREPIFNAHHPFLFYVTSGNNQIFAGTFCGT